MTTNGDLEQQFVRELQALEDQEAWLPYTFSPGQAWSLLAGLQLLLRHPAMNGQSAGPSAQFLRSLAGNIQERLCVSPAMRRVAEMGWNPEDDEAIVHPV